MDVSGRPTGSLRIPAWDGICARRNHPRNGPSSARRSAELHPGRPALDSISSGPLKRPSASSTALGGLASGLRVLLRDFCGHDPGHLPDAAPVRACRSRWCILVTGVAFLTLHHPFLGAAGAFHLSFHGAGGRGLAPPDASAQARLADPAADFRRLGESSRRLGWRRSLFLVLAMAGRLLDRMRHRVDGEEAPLIPWIGLTPSALLATSLNPWGWASAPPGFSFRDHL